MKKKRVASLMLALAMLGITACGNTQAGPEKQEAQGQETESAANTQNAAQPGQEADGGSTETVKLTYWVPIHAGASKYIASYNENIAYQEAMKRLGIEIEFIHPAIGQEQEEFNLLFLGDELPDIIAYADHYVGGEFQGMRDGMFLDLTDLLAENAPDYWKVLTEDEEFYRESTDNEGHVVSFNAYKPVGDPPFRRWLFNQALLDELGCEIPQTIPEFEAMFDKMLEKGITP